MKQKNKGVMRQYKLDLKRFGKYLLILIPIAIVEAFFVGMLGFEIWLNCIIIIPTLIVWCVVFELIYVALAKRKEKKAENTPKKKDIYSD